MEGIRNAPMWTFEGWLGTEGNLEPVFYLNIVASLQICFFIGGPSRLLVLLLVAVGVERLSKQPFWVFCPFFPKVSKASPLRYTAMSLLTILPPPKPSHLLTNAHIGFSHQQQKHNQFIFLLFVETYSALGYGEFH